jgi:pimeloyl-ACP methyl ester carboxylesterase
MRTETLKLPDGRQLSFEVGGDPGGYPVIGLHGTPGCRLNRWPADSAYADVGVLYVTTDRAGYGQASRRPGRRVADEARDVLAAADALGFERFGVIGGSGGGPHALACAALLAGRVERAACLSGLAPLGGAGQDAPGLPREAWLAGMSRENLEEVEWAEAGEAVLARELALQQRQLAGQLATDPAALFGDELSDGDRAFLERPEAIASFQLSIPEQAAHGVGGWVDDSLAFLAPWGFSLGLITMPVLLTYGLADVLCPPAHGEWLAANVPAATVIVSQEGGHLPSDPGGEIADNMAWLRDGIVPPAGRVDGGPGAARDCR